MFDQTFVDGVGKTKKSWTVALSFGLEFLAVGVMILIPLIWTGVLPKASAWSMLTAPAPPPRSATPLPAQKTVRVMRRVFHGNTLQVPITIPKHAAVINDEPLLPLSVSAGVGGLDASGLLGGTGVGESSIGVAPAQPAPAPPVAKELPEKPAGPYRQSSGVQAARCINCPKPAYPGFARQARVQGSVVLSAVIAKDGTVQKLTVVFSANPLLTSAAIDAVRKWVYIPTILNQEPVEVVTEITVNFALQ
jgi:periplasmic protein TonB